MNLVEKMLDYVLSELDEGRKQYLLTCMKEKQTFVTSCDDTDFLKTDGEVYRMDGGVAGPGLPGRGKLAAAVGLRAGIWYRCRNWSVPSRRQLILKEIADKYRFPDQFFFGRYFKKHTRMSPKEYRAKRTEA